MKFNIQSRLGISVILFIISLLIRIFTFIFIWSDLDHSSTRFYGSAAIGLYSGNGLTCNEAEMQAILNLPNPNGGNYLNQKDPGSRHVLTYQLPGPALLLSLLWKIIPVYNYTSVIIFQIILESLLIGLFYLVLHNDLRKIGRFIPWTIIIFLLFNIAQINKTLRSGYDFWPFYCSILFFMGLYYGLKMNKLFIVFLTSLLATITVWFNSITILLPAFLCIGIVLYLRRFKKERWVTTIKYVAVVLIPLFVYLSLLSIYKYNLSNESSPLRHTVWHAFFVGVGQFPNPYGLVPHDRAVENWAKESNPDLSKYPPKTIQLTHDYELFLKNKAVEFVRDYPGIFIRNFFCRIVIMISPALNNGNDFIHQSKVIPDIYLKILGFGSFVIWFPGLYFLFGNNRLLFHLSISVYLYFFVFFGWFLLQGRVFLPYLFILLLTYLCGMLSLLSLIKKIIPNKIL